MMAYPESARTYSARYWLGVVAFAVAYYLLAEFGLWIAPFIHGSVTAFWPASGMAIAVLVLFGGQYWPGILLGGFLASYGTVPAYVAFSFGAGDTLAALAAWWLLIRTGHFRAQLDRVTDIVKLTMWAAPIAALISAMVGTLALLLLDDLPSDTWLNVMMVWFLGDMIGNLVVAPALMVSYANRMFTPDRAQFVELLAVLLSMILLVSGLHLHWFGIANFDPQFILIIPFVVWAALRLGLIGTALTVLVAAFLAVALVLGDARLSGVKVPYIDVANLQLLLAMSVPGFLIAAALAEHKDSERKFEKLARHDSLTGLANRAALLVELEYAVAQAERRGTEVALLFMDLDRFKNINDTLGHAMGDLLLQELAQRIRNSVRQDDFVARLGGDEFTVLLQGEYAAESAAAVAQKILDAMRLPVLLQGHEYVVSGSIGIAALNGAVPRTPEIDPTDATLELMRQADTAMYRAKRQSAGFMYFNINMDSNSKLQLRLENSLRRALENHEFELYFQAKVAAGSGRIIGCEALLRWRHPVHGLIKPDKFIEVIESIGLMIPVGAWVLREACQQMQRWQQLGLPMQRVAVNLSMRQFLQPDLLAVVNQVLADSRLEANCLELEITESVAMSNAKQTIETLTALKQRGVHISIDDFGTGYSSLSYLKRFPIDAVKIDRSFIQDLAPDSDDAAIVMATIRLAHAMNLSVIAEGVETVQQRDFLLKYGCDVLQGYLYSRPVSADDYSILLRAGSL
jgi:diguanylate cyclase